MHVPRILLASRKAFEVCKRRKISKEKMSFTSTYIYASIVSFIYSALVSILHLNQYGCYIMMYTVMCKISHRNNIQIYHIVLTRRALHHRGAVMMRATSL